MSDELRIIDVSEHQLKIDWAKVKPHIDGAIIRTGYGDDIKSQDDKYAAYNLSECERLGIPYMTYIYSYADNGSHVKSEIEHEERMTEGRSSLGHVLDLEEWGMRGYGRKAADAWLKAFPESLIYAGQAWWKDPLKNLECRRWIPAYGTNSGKPESGFKPKYDMEGWQYTSRGYIPGIKGNVDISLWYVPFGKSQAKAKQKPTPKRRPVYKKEIAALIMMHLCTHAKHGYTQNMTRRQGTGTETIEIYGHKYTITGGDRDCSSAVISSYVAAGISCGKATYTGNMCSEMLKTGNFKWRPMSFTAQMGDSYLNIKTNGGHTAMCMSAEPDILAEFSHDEVGGANGKKMGDQLQKGEYDETLGRGESHLAYYYNAHWDGILECINDEIAFFIGGDEDEETHDMTDAEVAVQVMFNVHGSGDARRNALGERYDNVQKYVDRYWHDMDRFIKATKAFLDKYGVEGLKNG